MTPGLTLFLAMNMACPPGHIFAGRATNRGCARPVVVARCPIEVPCCPPVQAAPATTQSKADSELAWPTPTNNDFQLSVELVADATKEGGIVHLPKNIAIAIRIKSERDCNAILLWLDPNGQVTQLFPNAYDTKGQIKAGEERLVPGKQASEYELMTTPTEGSGVERLLVMATTAEMALPPRGEPAGGYLVYRTPQQIEQLKTHVRGVVIRAKAGAASASAPLLAVAELSFRVNQ